MRVDEHEITTEVALCGSDGRLNPVAAGWTRRPLHDTSGSASAAMAGGATSGGSTGPSPPRTIWWA